MRACIAIIKRDVRIALRQPTDTLILLFFFVIAVALFPIGVGPQPELLARMAPAVLWVTALLTAMLSFDRLFLVDYEDGTLDQIVMSPMPLEVLVAARLLAHWLTTGIPLLAASPVLAVMLHLEPGSYGVVLVAMALGTATISLLGGLGAALVVGARRGSVLVALLVLPLLIPVLVFGTTAVEAAAMGYRLGPSLMLLAALSLASMVLCPWGAAAALRIAVE